MKDYRLKEHRKEGFLRYWYYILKTEDYDPAYHSLNYIYDRYEMNVEQRFWISWLYGAIYNPSTAFVVWNEFPDFENVGLERLHDWNASNWQRLVYETDTRYKKGKLYEMFVSYKDAVGDQTQQEFFLRHCKDSDPRKNFRHLWDVVSGFHLFGRYSSFFYLETLRNCNDLPIECDSLFLRDGGSKSHRNGLCYVLGRDEWDMHKKNPTFIRYTDEQLKYLEEEADILVQEMKDLFPDVKHMVDYLTMETALCAYKGMFRERRYPGFYLDRQWEEIHKSEKAQWNGIDWEPMWQSRSECLYPRTLCELNPQEQNGPSKEKQKTFMSTGELINMDQFFDDMKQQPGGLAEWMV